MPQNKANLEEVNEIKYMDAVISFLRLEEPWSPLAIDKKGTLQIQAGCTDTQGTTRPLFIMLSCTQMS